MLYYTIATVVSVLLVSAVAWTASPFSSLFSWHPTLMTLAFGLCMTQAILAFSPQNFLTKSWPRSRKVTMHWIVQLLFVAASLTGFLVIVYNKSLGGKAHFTTWHSWLGLAAFTLSSTQAALGVFLLYPKYLVFLTLAQLKRIHALAGLQNFSLGASAIVLGFFSNWFAKQGYSLGIRYVFVACPVILVLCIASQILKPVFRKKA